jgi:hypothetical protein
MLNFHAKQTDAWKIMGNATISSNVNSRRSRIATAFNIHLYSPEREEVSARDMV